MRYRLTWQSDSYLAATNQVTKAPATPGLFSLLYRVIVTPCFPYSNGVLMNDIHARQPVLLFMKAVTKKQVWIPGFTKRNGQVVQGHYAMVNVSTDHDEHKAVSGQGNYTEKEAHKKLSKKDWFNAMPHDHKVAHVLKEATAIQSQASMLSRANSLKKKLLAGEKPTPGEWKAFDSLPVAKQAQFEAEFKAAGKEEAFGQQWFDWQAANPKQQQAPQQAPAEPPKVVAAKEEPEVAETVPEPKDEPTPESKPEPEGQTGKDLGASNDAKAAVIDKIEAAKAKLPADHHITPGQKKKLDGIAHALITGDEKSILNHGYPTHTYGKQAAKLANEALAAMGSKHTVTPGQKMGGHAALTGEGVPAAETKPQPAAEPQKVVAASAEAKPAENPDAPKAKGAAPAIPDDLDPAYKQAAKAVAEWAESGLLEELKKMATLAGADGEMAKLKDYAAALYEWKTGEKAKGETPMPAHQGVDAGLKEDADKALEEGDLQTLKDIHAYTTKEGMGPTADYAAKHIATLEAKVAESVKPTEPGAKPVKPQLSSITSSQIADKIEKELNAGNLQGLMDQATMIGAGQPAATNFGKLEKYAAEAIAHLEGKAAPAAAVPMVKKNVTQHLYHNTEEGHNKFWGVSVVGNAMRVHYGKIGSKGSVSTKEFSTELAAYQAQSKLIAEKQNNGYVHQNSDTITVEVPDKAAAAATGPKEGDTKRGADGMLVLKNGHWVKVGGDEPAAKTGPEAAKIVAGLKVPKITGKNSVKLKNHIKNMNLVAATQGAEGLSKVLSITPEGKVKYNGLIALSPTEQAHGPAALAFAQYGKQLHDAVIGAGAVGSGESAAPKAAPKAQKVMGTAQPAATESVDDWTQVGPQGGYNPGGTYTDKSGQKWYVKFPAGGEKVAKNELVATKLYALAGVEVPEVKLINQGGKIGLASKIVDGAVANKSALLEGKAKGLLSGFGADAWLANWDTVGNNPAAGKGFDNILFKQDGSAVRIDAGGALLYGGAGGKKQKFEDDVIELKTMLDPSKNANTAAVFGKMSAADIAASVAKIADIPDHEIEGVVMEFGPGSESEKTRLAEKLIARKHNMSEQYPNAAKPKKGSAAAAKVKPNPAALTVDASLLPSPHDYMNWQGTGKPISEKAYVKGNIADEQELLNIAKSGNLTALKAYKFQPVDKMTGEAIGEKKSIDEHPSKYVQDYHTNLVSYLDMIANPPEALRPFETKSASTLASLSAAFKPHDFGKTTEMAPKNQQLGFWIALGVADSPAKFIPAVKKLSSAAIAAAQAAHSKLPSSVKSFISGVQGSGSYNNPYRDGKETDHGGNKTREVLTDLYKIAAPQEAGTTISKWISFAPEMVKQFMDAPDGLVFQNPGSMCTSYHDTATKHFGKDRITIRYAEGAKALNSFASGSFKSEMEVTTLPGARFMVMSRKMVADVEHGNSNGQRFELELLMLPPDPTYVDNLMKKKA